MEEDLDAVAVLLKKYGEDSLKSRAADLLALANEITLAADELGVPHGELSLAAAELQAAESSDGRLRAVIRLGSAAAALERAPCARLDADATIRGAARQSERACTDHRQAAESMQVVLRAAAERAAWREGRLADWLWLRFRRFLRSCFRPGLV